jgi:undecaprenyl-phosphate galactose phosphotransferase
MSSDCSVGWKKLKPWQIRLTKAFLLLSDALSFFLAGLIAAAMAKAWSVSAQTDWLETQDLGRYWVWLKVVGLGIVFFLVRFRHYSDRKPFWTELGEVLRTVMILAVLDLAVLALTRWNSSRLWWALVWPMAMLCVPLGRGLARSLMRRAGVWQRPTLIVGNGPNAHEAVANALKGVKVRGAHGVVPSKRGGGK